MDAPPQLSIVPFRHAPAGVADRRAQQRLAEAIQADGRVYLASALIDGEVWLRPCFVNFRTTDEDVLAILDVARELGDRLAQEPHERGSLAGRAQGDGGARRSSAGLPGDVGDLEPVPRAAAVRRHMEAKVLATEHVSWTSFVGLWVLWVWGELETRDSPRPSGSAARPRPVC